MSPILGGACLLGALIFVYRSGRKVHDEERLDEARTWFDAGWQGAMETMSDAIIARDPTQETGFMVVPYGPYRAQVEAAREGRQ